MFARAIWRQRGILAGEQCSPLQRPQSLPCVKGGAPQGRRDCGLTKVVRCMGKVTIPQSASLTAPFTQGSHPSTPIEFLLAPKGSMWREVKKREEKRSTPAFFSFFTSRPPLWGSQGAGPLGRGTLPRNSETFFASFFGHKKGRPFGSIPLKKWLTARW